MIYKYYGEYMDINRKQALKMWDEIHGKTTQKAVDFAGRIIYKDSYGNGDNINGQNIDHIKPKSKGGKDDISNLQIVHLLTNQEKGDNYPNFKANDKEYEIKEENGKFKMFLKDGNNLKEVKSFKTLEDSKKSNAIEGVDANKNLKSNTNNAITKPSKEIKSNDNIPSTLKHIKDLDNNKNSKTYSGSILIRINNLKNESLIKFIKENFNEEDFIFFNIGKGRDVITNILIRKYDISLKKDNSYLMNKCIFMNTYLKNYFLKKEYFKSYDIHYEITCSDDINLKNMTHKGLKILNTMYFNDLVVSNMMSEEVLDDATINMNHFNTYDLEIKSLKEELFKEVNNVVQLIYILNFFS